MARGFPRPHGTSEEPLPAAALLIRVLEFLGAIGIAVRAADLSESTFLPGLSIREGALLIDESRLLHPGDILHEAGHLAMIPPRERTGATAPLDADGGMEMAAIAWSYAAAVHLNVPVDVLFHPSGYKGNSQALIQNFSEGRFIGVPMLEWFGLTLTGDRAATAGVPAYPCMLRWLRE